MTAILTSDLPLLIGLLFSAYGTGWLSGFYLLLIKQSFDKIK